MYDFQQYPETQFYPGFPFFPPSPAPFPTPQPRDLELRVTQLERVTELQSEEIKRLNRRLRRLERQIGFGIGENYY